MGTARPHGEGCDEEVADRLSGGAGCGDGMFTYCRYSLVGGDDLSVMGFMVSNTVSVPNVSKKIRKSMSSGSN